MRWRTEAEAESEAEAEAEAEAVVSQCDGGWLVGWLGGWVLWNSHSKALTARCSAIDVIDWRHIA